MMNFFWSYQDLQDMGNPIAHIGHYTQYGLPNFSNPAIVSFNVATGSKILIVCISSITTSIRESGAPTWNGVALTSVGTPDGTHNSEIWYLLNPDIGTYNLSIPNNPVVNLQVTASWYSCSNDLSLHGYERYNGNSGTIGGNIDLPLNKELIIIDCVTYKLYLTSPSLTLVSNTDENIFFGVSGAVGGSSRQYKTYLNTADSSHYMGWGITNTSWPWDDLIAVFSMP